MHAGWAGYLDPLPSGQGKNNPAAKRHCLLGQGVKFQVRRWAALLLTAVAASPMEQAAPLRVQRLPVIPPDRKITRNQHSAYPLTDAALPYPPNRFDDLFDRCRVAILALKPGGGIRDHSLLQLRPSWVRGQSFNRRNRQHDFGDWIRVHLGEIQHPYSSLNAKPIVHRRVTLRECLLKSANKNHRHLNAPSPSPVQGEQTASSRRLGEPEPHECRERCACRDLGRRFLATPRD